MPKAPEPEKLKKSSGKSMLTSLKKMAGAFNRRYREVIRVIDEALASENLRERIWAVDQILKRTKPEVWESAELSKARTQAAKLAKTLDPALLSDTELLSRIEAYLYDAPKN